MKKVKFNVWRNVLQLGVLAYLIFLLFRQFIDSTYTADFEAYCPFGGLQALSSYIEKGTLACSMTSVQIFAGILLVLCVLLFSKLFCSYICPLGTITEWLGKLGDKIGIRISFKGIVDKIFRSLKYILLFITFYFSVTSSELFCKNFDPFFAAFTGMHPDVTVWMALIGFILLLVGSVFVRMFWCKYICPFGAIANIFKFALLFVGSVVVFSLIRYFGIELSWVYLLGVNCLGAYIIEITKMKSKYTPLVKVTRNAESCINCGLCSKKCHQGIDVANLSVVKDVDCNLCGDCVSACPVEKTLNYNKKVNLKYLPAILIVVLSIVCVCFGDSWEVATISEKWGTPQEIEKAKVFEKSGLRNVKCYGSSKAFSAKMKKIRGVLGVSTYVKHHSVKIWYNPSVISEDQLIRKIFTPVKMKIAHPEKGIEKFKVIKLGIENLFQKMDANFLKLKLREVEGIYGMQTEYGCPVVVTLYVNPSVNFTEDKLKPIIEAEKLVLKAHGKERVFNTEFELLSFTPVDSLVDRKEFLNSVFKKYANEYKGRRAKCNPEDIKTYQIAHKSLEKPIVFRALPYLSSHLSNNKNIIKIETIMLEDERVVLNITYSAKELDDEKIWEILNAKQWKITFSNGKVKEMPPKMKFNEKGKTLN